jgi:YVTN family beta-propeller protein
MMRKAFIVLYLVCLTAFFAGSVGAVTYAYIPSTGDGNVVQINTADETFATTAFGDDPYGVAVTSQGDYLLVTRPTANSVTLVRTGSFDSTSAQVLRDVGTEPRGVAVESQGNYAYVANYGSGTVSEIYIPSFTVTDTINVGNGPWGVAATYDEVDATPKVYVSNNSDNSISVIDDTATQTISGVGNGPLGLALTPDGAYLYVALNEAAAVAIYKTSDRTLVKTIATGNGPWGVAIGSDGGYVYVTNSLNNSVTVIDAGTQDVFRTYTVGRVPTGVACPKNGDFAYVINQMDNTVSKIDITNNSVVLIDDQIAISEAYGLGAFIGGAPPGAPSDLSAALNTDNQTDNQIDLSWTDNSSDELGFKIERRPDTATRFSQIATVDAGVTSYLDSSLADNTTYTYRVRSFNEVADSEYATTTGVTTTDTKRFSWCFIQSLLR